MESFSRADFHIGGLAIIIGCNKSENEKMIGKTVTIDGLYSPEDNFPTYFMTPEGKQLMDVVGEDRTCNYHSAVIRSESLDANRYWQKGYGYIQLKYLMPIQTDSDDVFEKEENPYLKSLSK